MPTMGKHRRTKSNPLTRGLVAFTAGGAVLALPVIGATTASAAPAQSANAAKSGVSASAPAKAITAEKAGITSYSVVKGDSLHKIAQGHSLDGGWQKLYKDNKKAVGDNPELIRPGLKLTIGAKSQAKASGSSAERTASTGRADRSARSSTPPAAKAAAPAVKAATYTNDLDGWIKESLAVMAENGIPGTYEGIHRNIMRESSGNPQIVNNWDSNAAKGTPSKGLLQVIDPTFQAYHVPGTSTDSFDPVANITAACNYAADRYGSIDNVFGAY
ncbi:transglycosylase SLT domain-containing protein [Streptomyces finlayi]|uniref:Transglycosylase SLT domain-containing protein n=1 Tax=Streptomyces finlayi TaxID=67296 RepID=A0A7G7BUA4_9ACTN|nr:LysM peptidoglycan-binding domain-containing protein [Streptomyces finlayi]QNE78919.1 transglycosylase SLT domain-containing protein [Streptomyces finlayi]